MKKILCVGLILNFMLPFFSEGLVNENSEVKKDFVYEKTVTVPESKFPKAPEQERLEKASKKDTDESFLRETKAALEYGTPSEIKGKINSIIENDDPRFDKTLYDLFKIAENNEIKQKILEYFAKQKDSCLADFAVELLDDPYDMPNSLVEAAFNYVAEAECKEAAPALVAILENGDEKYFSPALHALGKTGGTEEALYLANYIDREDLTVVQKQTLMRTLGLMNAVETWEKLSEIVQDEDENDFVRMYAAEAIGNMKKEESVPILVKLFREGNPNLRQYCIKGLANFSDSEAAKKTMMQAVRDEHYKVRLEAINAVSELNYTQADEYLIYRAKNDSENAVKNAVYPVIAKLNTENGNNFLISQITEKKVPDSQKANAAKALSENGNIGEEEILKLAEETLKDDKRKSLRYELGKIFIKHAKPGYEKICAMYLESKDVTAINQGLDMYKNARYESAYVLVQKLVNNKNTNSAVKKRAEKILGVEEAASEDSYNTESIKDAK